jgi:hypothetical protein
LRLQRERWECVRKQKKNEGGGKATALIVQSPKQHLKRVEIEPEWWSFQAENFTDCGGNAGCLIQGIVGLRRAVPDHAASMQIATAREIAFVAAAAQV